MTAPSYPLAVDQQSKTPKGVIAHVPGLDLTQGWQPASVAVLGLGYVGLPTALALADTGVRVLGIDISRARLDSIKRGDVDLLESDRARLARWAGSPCFELSEDVARLSETDVIIICVPTPIDAHRAPDLEALQAACDMVVQSAVRGQLVILTSTTYVGTTRDLLVRPLEARGLAVGEDVYVAFSPERIDPGNSTHTQQTTPRVIGGVTAKCARRARTFLGSVCPLVHEVSSTESAEMTKLLENTFRAVNIAFINEFADACRVLDLDIGEVVDAAATKPYGFMRFEPGPGVGGHCIPCDPHYLLWQMRERRSLMPITAAAMDGIAQRPVEVVRRSRELLGDRGVPIFGARILVVGVAYKPGVGDVRESPALAIIDELETLGAEVAFHDPLCTRLRRKDGSWLSANQQPWDDEWDLVIAHTLHPGTAQDWIWGSPLVLDTTHRLPESRSVVRL